MAKSTLILIILLLSGSLRMCFGQETVLTSIYANGDTIVSKIDYQNAKTITRYFDIEDRLTDEYKDGYIVQRLEYAKQTPSTLADLTISVLPKSIQEVSYQFEEGDTVQIDLLFLKSKKLKRKFFKKNNFLYFDMETKQLREMTAEDFKSIKDKKDENGKEVFIKEKKCKERKLAQANLIYGEKGYIFSEKVKCQKTWNKVIENSGGYSLKIQNPVRFFSKHCYLKIERRPKDIVNKTNYTRDSISIESTEKFALHDTLLIPIFEEEIYLQPRLNIENTPYQIRKIDLILPNEKGTKSSWTYWLGIGEEAQAAFDKLEATIPEDWSKPGVEKAMGAYAMGRNILLPTFTNDDVLFLLGNNRQIQIAREKLERGGEGSTIISVFQRDRKLPISNTSYLLLSNQNTINGYKVYVKIIAMQVKTQWQERKISTKVLGRPHPVE